MSTDPPNLLPPQYTPADVEAGMAKRWADAHAYASRADAPGDPFSICIPPPNVTAALHLGHALNNTLQDVLTRAARMQGYNAVWLPGTDHAGIATQTVVDKRLQAEGKKALKDYKQQEATSGGGRDAFIAEVQKWKDEYETRITDQLKAMGCSCDWDRQAFTMDDARSKAVREAFFKLFRDGLIYRGKRLVNWDPVTQTALADDEVEMEDVDGNFYYLRYLVCDAAGTETGDHVTVATTRPETMLGDTAVAVNPDDAPRNKYVGQYVKLPIVGRVIPIIADDYVVIPDKDSDDSKARMASGFLKVTPAHDPNDYDIGQRHDLPIINVMAPDASISTQHGWPTEEKPEQNKQLQPFLGLSREDARRELVKWFKTENLCEKIVSYRHAVGHSYRSHVPVEPYYSDQWYLKVTDDKMKGNALRAMDASQRQASEDSAFQAEAERHTTGLKFTPERYAKTFQSWHENLRDWCISRQLWWGHRIPVWRRDHAAKQLPEDLASFTAQIMAWQQAGRVAVQYRGEFVSLESFELQDADLTAFFVAVHDPEGEDADVVDALEFHGLVRDPDVLDTWFSSALWPMSTLGWPEESADLDLWNPTSVLCTAREIITLWVSRMVMFNLYFRGTLPFKDVFIHAMIQDGHGQKMSKSLGNGVDPIDIIHSHGSDAMRFTLASMTTQTQDVRMPVDMVDPHNGEGFTPKFITTKAGHKVAAPIQEHDGKQCVSSYGVASGEAKPTDEMPLARNSSEKFDLGQRFANKMWNATRFALTKLDHAACVADGADEASGGPTLPERWVLSRLARTVEACNDALQNYAFSEYATALYDFFWRDLCDWYIEAVKPRIAASPNMQRTLAACLDAALRLLHPVMPFVTERLWEALNDAWPDTRSIDGLMLQPSELLVSASWPHVADVLIDADAETEFGRTQEIVGSIREARNRAKVPPRETIELSSEEPAAIAKSVAENRWIAEGLANFRGREFGPKVEAPDGAAVILAGGCKIYLHGLGGDSAEETERLTAEAGELRKSVANFEKRLSNTKYVEKAPAHLVQETRDQLAATQKQLETIETQLAALS
ncbi:MAG: valine--tRNA ligase [Planctomycetota bacterium]